MRLKLYIVLFRKVHEVLIKHKALRFVFSHFFQFFDSLLSKLAIERLEEVKASLFKLICDLLQSGVSQRENELHGSHAFEDIFNAFLGEVVKVVTAHIGELGEFGSLHDGLPHYLELEIV